MLSCFEKLPGPLCALLLLAQSGCASHAELFGERARYSPAYRSYVLAPEEGSDDPDPDDARLLVHPLSGKKIRCREQLGHWLQPQQDAATDELYDERAQLGSALIMAPLSLSGAALAFAGSVFLGGAMTPAKMVATDLPEDLYPEGFELYQRERYEEAAKVFERIAAKSRSFATSNLTFYFLGICYAQQEKYEQAAETFQAFIEHSNVRDAEAYRVAEAWLESLDAPLPACDSAEPIPLSW